MKYSVAIIKVYHGVSNEVGDEHVFDTKDEAKNFVNAWNTMQYVMGSNPSDPRVVAMDPIPFQE